MCVHHVPVVQSGISATNYENEFEGWVDAAPRYSWRSYCQRCEGSAEFGVLPRYFSEKTRFSGAE